MSLTSSDIEKFVSVLKMSGLIEESALQVVVANYLEEAETPTPEELAAHLIEQELITPWHGSKLLKSKHKGFFLGKYKLLSLLGKGGMSSVYLAEHVNMKRRCAVKVLPYKFVSDSSYLARFYREAQAVAALDHKNIVRAYDVDHVTDGDMEIHFLVMEYVTGLNFYELVKTQGPLSPRQAAEYVAQGALGIEHAHEAGIVHRDIKPGNLIIDNNGTVKLMDLGLAMVHEENQDFSVTLDNDEKVLGTADYLAPEQAVDSHLIDSRADIYALGCTFFFLLAGRPPFDEGTLTQRLLAHQTKEPADLNELREGVPAELTSLIKEMMAKDPDKRIQTAGEVAARLEQWLAKPESEEEGDSFPQIVINPDSEAASNENPTGAISDFLSHLEDRSSKTSKSSSRSGSKPESKKDRGKPSNPKSKPVLAKSPDAEASVFNSGMSSIVISNSSSSHRSEKQRKKIFGTKPVNVALLTGAVIVGLFAIYSFTRPAETPIAVTESPDSSPVVTSDQKVLQNETIIRIGPNGDFQLISAAIKYLLDPSNSVAAAKVHEIRVASDQTLVDTIQLANSGLETLPKPLLITGEGPKLPVLKSQQGAVIEIDSIEELTIANFQIDSQERTVAIELTGYLSGTKLQNLNFMNLSGVGVHAIGASGLVGHPLSLTGCQFDASNESAIGIRCVGSDFSNTRLMEITSCRFIGPMAKGIVFSSPHGSTWDLNISQSIFYKTLAGISFAGEAHDLNGITIASNTFFEFGRGIQFESGPVPASSGITFIQNLFANGTGYEVATDIENVSLKELAANALPPQSNWSTGDQQTSSNWLNIFADNGKLATQEIEFKSTDPKSVEFMKPQGTLAATSVATPFNGRNYIGAVAP